jgi:hypothetical protein
MQLVAGGDDMDPVRWPLGDEEYPDRGDVQAASLNRVS